MSCKEALLGFLSCITPYTQVQLLWKILGGNCHVAELQIVPGSSEAIAHRTCIVIWNAELTLVSSHAVIGQTF